jgi:hypothetical protein
MSSNGNGETGGSGKEWGEARDRFDVVRETRDMEEKTAIDTFQDLGFATNRGSLPGVIAADIAFNPFSTYGTSGEQNLATAQAFLPGGLALGAIRAAMMTGKSPKGTGPDLGPDLNPAEPNTLLKRKSKPGSAKKTTPAAARGRGVTPNPVVQVAQSAARGSPTSGQRGILTSTSGDRSTASVSRKNLLGA